MSAGSCSVAIPITHPDPLLLTMPLLEMSLPERSKTLILRF